MSEKHVITTNNEFISIVSKRSVILNIFIKDRKKQIKIINVFHCSNLYYNLLKVKTLKLKEFSISIKNEKFKFLNFESEIILIEIKASEENYYINIFLIKIKRFHFFINFKSSKTF